MHPMSFPPADSDHKRISHFHINSLTGKVFDELRGNPNHFPMEKAMRIMAHEIMKEGYTDEHGGRSKPATEANAHAMAKEIFNSATHRFNDIKRKNGDDFHILPIPFGEDGRLHHEYMTNHYGSHQSRRIPTSQRQTRDEKGRLINNHTNNKPHPTLGLHLESAALHIANELNDETEKRGIQTSIGAKQNVIEPQQITGGVTRRYSSNEQDPTSKHNTTFPSHYKEKHAETAAYGQIKPMDIVSVLPNDFFVPSSRGGMSSKIMGQLIGMGYNDDQARQMARAPVNQLLYGRGKDGSETGLRIAMKAMRDALGINDNPEVESLYTKHRDHFAPMVRGGDRGRNTAAIEILGMLKTAEEMGIDSNAFSSMGQAPKSVINGWREVALAQGGKPIDMSSLGVAEEQHSMRGKFNNNYEHLHDAFPPYLSSGGMGAIQQPMDPVLPPQEELSGEPPKDTTQKPLAQDPVPGGAANAPTPFYQNPNLFPTWDEDKFKFSDDDPMGIIATIMERVQLHEAGGSLLQKYDPMDKNDMNQLATNVGLTSVDVRAVAMSIGDWGSIAKSFNTTLTVVNTIKTSCGGAFNE